PDGTPARLDVDANGDGDFDDPGEADAGVASVQSGQAVLGLPGGLAVGSYTVRVPVTDPAGNQGAATATAPVGSAGPGIRASATLDPWSDPVRPVLYGLDLDLNPGTSVGGDPALAYNYERVSVRPIVAADVTLDSAQPTPASYTVQLVWDGVVQQAQTFALPSDVPGGTVRVEQQVADVVSVTGRPGYTLKVTLNYDTPVELDLTGAMLVVSADTSPYGAGWTFGPVDYLVPIAESYGEPAGLLRVFGWKSYAFYKDNGGSYEAPPGDDG